MLAWGNKVSAAFRTRVVSMAADTKVSDPSWFMACMAFESGETFRSDVRNAAGSGAVGLIQFMPATAAGLGTTTDLLAQMTPERQLDYVYQYFRHWSGKMKTLGDVYGVILWPAMVGLSDDAIVFDSKNALHPKLYLQNRGLDLNKDGVITKSEIVSRVQQELDKGLLPQNSTEILTS